MDFPSLRMFRLAPGRVSCDRSGLRIGAIDLLNYSAGAGWSVGDASALNSKLAKLYGFPVDITHKQNGLTVVARALTSGDVALAQIAALLLQVPDPPEGDAADDGRSLVDLAACGLLKAEADFDAKHPRTGAPPNPG